MKIKLSFHGTVWGFTPLDKEADKWLHTIGAADWQWLGQSVFMDWRVAREFVANTKREDGVGVEYIRQQ